jgi:hypothetical protein
VVFEDYKMKMTEENYIMKKKEVYKNKTIKSIKNKMTRKNDIKKTMQKTTIRM